MIRPFSQARRHRAALALLVAGAASCSSGGSEPVCKVTGVTISPPVTQVQKYLTTSLSANVQATSCNPAPTVAWSSGSPSIASVTQGGVVEGIAEGTATITATATSVSGTASVTVTAAAVAAIDISPVGPTVAAGNTVALTAITRDSRGNVILGRQVSWQSLTTSVATVNATTGVVTGVAPGSATITATSEGRVGTVTVLVTAASVASVVVTSPIESVMAVGRSAQMSAVARDANQNPLSVSFSWLSTVAAFATVHPVSGLVTGMAPGTTTIRASQNTNAVTGEFQMRVVNANLAAVTAALSDAFMQALRLGLSTAPSNAVAQLIADCQVHLASGNILGIDRCLTGLKNTVGANGNDTALLGVLRLFAAYAQQQLSL